jgi:uracil-DNA glycosylase
MLNIKLDSSWKKLLAAEIHQTYMNDLLAFLEREISLGKLIYPPSEDIFAALNLTPLDQVKVVILGQDPYHGQGQAHGLCFSVNRGIAIPPSLQNIYKELKNDLNITPPEHGHLESWAKQGVLLLNNVLTVEHGKAGSHHKQGWERFTDKIIELLNEKKENLVFILWGSPAQKKAAKVDQNKHLLIKCVHPSPLSSYRGFFGSRPFSKANTYLESKGISPVDWSLPL